MALFKTVIGAKVASDGTVTFKLVALAEVTAAFVAPKNTILLATVVLKPVPVIVTAVPGEPVKGENAVMVGAWPNDVNAGKAVMHNTAIV